MIDGPTGPRGVTKKGRAGVIAMLERRHTAASKRINAKLSQAVKKQADKARAKLIRTINETYRMTADAEFRAKYVVELQEHQQALRDLGLDPDLIGEHEVDPVCCPSCGNPIPWNVLNRYEP